MRFSRSKTMWFVALAAVLAMPFAGFAQNVNDNRDEVVNVVAAGNPEGKDEVLKIFRPENKVESLNYITEIVEMKYANSDEVAAYIDEAVGLEGGVTKSLEYSDPKQGGKLRYFLQVVTTDAQMPSVLKAIQTIDLPDMLEAGGDPDFEVRTRYRKASEVADILGALGVNEVLADDLTNTVHFEDSESKLKLLDFYDVPPLQVQFEIQIIEVWGDEVDNNAQKVGIDWDAWKRSAGGEAQYLGGPGQSPRLDWLLTLDAAVLADFLNYTAQSGHAEIKQKIVMNINNDATGIISNTRVIPVYGYERSPAAADLVKDTDRGSEVELVADQARFEKVLVGEAEEGIVITIAPVIGMELVTIDLGIDARTLNGYDEMDRPLLSQQTFETNITLKNLQILHAATIDKRSEIKTRRGIPGLRDIPFLKYLFSVENTVVETSKVFIIITPCYCESVSYEARQKGGPGEILRFKDTQVPAYLLREMLMADEPVLQTKD